ncbi:protein DETOXIFICATION 44, chloroplastic isoform X2 [Coffea arabica]|uniref:Protein DETOXIFICATION n=1 Tax=Coffea arabica TaxID=13443 RepID=A0A6P6SQZ0_COFAR|nr:protein DETOXIFICATION 44, chloroplastic-like isoform X2 [Coffea arabica]
MALACGLARHRCHSHLHNLFLIGNSNPNPNRSCFFYSTIRPPFKSQKLSSAGNRLTTLSTARLQQNVPKSSPNDPSTNTLPQAKTQPSRSDNLVDQPDSNPDSGNVLKLDVLALEILSIALPAALALLADPITSLVDTAFVGHLGSVELAAVGVSVSVFNLVSKLFNVPLLNLTTSFVAEEQAAITNGSNESGPPVCDGPPDHKGKILLPSVSTSLALATGLGIAETVALSVGSGFLMNTMGIPAESSMRIPAEQFLTLRAFGAPPLVIALAAQGTFRGFKDTKTPLYAVGAGNVLNAILDAILIFCFGIGVAGAAIATVISEYLTAFILLSKLNDKVQLMTPNVDAGRVARYLKSGGLLIGRSLAVLMITTLATSMAAREGAISMAGHQICFQVWLAVSLLTDALALAGQALLASGYSQGSYGEAREVVYKVLQIGLITGVALAVFLFLGFGALSSLFTVDSEVLKIARSGTLFVAGSQPMNALAFVLDGLYYGVSDFGYAAYSMIVIGVISAVILLVATYFWGLAGVWAGLFSFMTLRVAAGILRLGARGGPWKFLWSGVERESA